MRRSFGFFFTDENEEQRLKLSARMMAYWGNFARTGNPSEGPAETSLAWRPWTAGKRRTMVFDTDATSGTRMMRYTGSMAALVERFVADDRFRDDVDRCKSAEVAADTAISTGVTPGPWQPLVMRYCQTSKETS